MKKFFFITTLFLFSPIVTSLSDQFDGKGLKCGNIENFIFVESKMASYRFGIEKLEVKAEYEYKVDLKNIYFNFAFMDTYIDRRTLYWHNSTNNNSILAKCELVTHKQISKDFEEAKRNAKIKNKL